MNKGIVSLYILFAVVLGATFGLLGRYASELEVQAGGHRNVWGDPVVLREGDCVGECGQSEGTKLVTYRQTCERVDERGDDECSIDRVWDSCPQGYHVSLLNDEK